MKVLYVDLETTGTKHWRNGIHQISGMVEIDGEIKEVFDHHVAPNPKCEIDPEALRICGVTLEQIQAYPAMGVVYQQIVTMLAKYVDRFNSKDKFYIVGFNSAAFDIPFLRAFFKQNLDEYFGSWFWSDNHDVMVLASVKLAPVRHLMLNFKLKSVAEALGVEVDEAKLHDGFYDIQLTEKSYKKLIC